MVDGVSVTMSMPVTIEMIMLAVGALIICLKVDKEKIINSTVAKAGFIAIVSIFGIAWLGDTFVKSNGDLIHGSIGHIAGFIRVL